MASKCKELLDKLKAAYDATDTNTCGDLLGQLKLLIFSSTEDTNEFLLLARETLEIACFLSIKCRDQTGFERHVAQLKMYYNDYNHLEASQHKYTIMGLYLLHLLASDRIGEFHLELELIPVDDYANKHISQPIQLEAYLMEGNYAKVLEKKNELSQDHYAFFLERLVEMVRQKVGTSMENTYAHLPVQEAAKMLILPDVAALQEFAVKENERKAREEDDDPMGDMTPSLTRRAPIGVVRWEVKDGKLYFTRSAEKRLEINALDIMVNTIGYATDLERIV